LANHNKWVLQVGQEDEMELLMTAITITGGMTFSLLVAIFVEELIFGKVLAPLFGRRLAQATSGQKR
jgi:hypothetical protein